LFLFSSVLLQGCRVQLGRRHSSGCLVSKLSQCSIVVFVFCCAATVANDCFCFSLVLLQAAGCSLEGGIQMSGIWIAHNSKLIVVSDFCCAATVAHHCSSFAFVLLPVCRVQTGKEALDIEHLAHLQR